MEPITNTELAILGLLAEGQKHAYGLEQDIAARGMRAWTEIGFSSIYYVLNKLESAGLLASVLVDEGEPEPLAPAADESLPEGRGRGPMHRDAARRRGPARRVYQLTKTGWEDYRAAVYERLAHPRPRSADFELGLANLPALPPEAARAALETYRASLRGSITSVRAKQQADRSAAEKAGHAFPPHVIALFERSLYLMQAELDWIETYLSKDQSDEHPGTR